MRWDGLLTSAEAAARLGIKVSTLYVYVSRGPWSSTADPTDAGACSLRSTTWNAWHDVREVAVRWASRMAVWTALTELGLPHGSYTEGERRSSWPPGHRRRRSRTCRGNAEPGPWTPSAPTPPPGLTPRDRLAWTVAMADRTRSEPTTDPMPWCARRYSSSRRSPPTPHPPPPDTPLAQRLAAACTTPDPSPEVIDAIRVAMVVLADHELATSTLAVRLLRRPGPTCTTRCLPGWAPWPVRDRLGQRPGRRPVDQCRPRGRRPCDGPGVALAGARPRVRARRLPRR